MAEFVHLHNHTEYSLLDGACRLTTDKGEPSELFDIIAKKHKSPALAITDHGNMYGAMEFYWAAKQSGIKPIIGCEVYVAPQSRFDKTQNAPDDDSGYYRHLTLLAKDYEGYQNLMRIVSAGFLEGFYYKPRVDKEVLCKYSKGIIAMSGCIVGEVANFLLKDDAKNALESAITYRDIFGEGNFYLEIMDHGLEEEKKVLPEIIALSQKTQIPLAATNDCHFLKKEDYDAHGVLLCIGTKKNLSDPNRFKFDSDLFYYRSPEEMANLFSYKPDALKNTLAIAEKINLEIDTNKLYLPKFDIPKEYKDDNDYLEKLCWDGLKRRYPNAQKEHKDRLIHELAIIKDMGFSSYFLIVQDFIKYAKDNKISVGPGRGSGAGSIVAYVLGITDICPLQYGLLFERFLNPSRISMPDLDIDFADTGRDAVKEYVRNKYGDDKVAQIITFGSLQSKAVIKDVARVMEISIPDANQIAALVPQGAALNEAITNSSELRKKIDSDERFKKLWVYAKKLEGLKRHTGVHAAGVLIANEAITNYSPLSKDKHDIVTTQYDGEVLPKLGLLKVDFLGLGTLSIIEECISLIKEKNKDFDLNKIPLDDAKTYELLSKARSLGVFQLESDGLMDLMRRLKPEKIDEIIALIALYRPGPMGSGMLDDFVNRKHGRQKIKYDHPLQEPILKETYGVILYQEQAMRMAMDLAGFTASEADGLRKAMSKKKPEVMAKEKDKFLSGAHKKGIDKKIASKIFDNVEAFAGYGFNKSHSAAYAIVTYRTAYLKANYTIEYFTALLNSAMGKMSAKRNEEDSRLTLYLNDAKKFGIAILPPNVQDSNGKFKIENGAIRFGILATKTVGERVSETIEQARAEGGKFKNWDDFLQRIDLKSINKLAMESLAKAGFFDCFGNDKAKIRAQIIASIESSIDKAEKVKAEKDSAQGMLFGMVKELEEKSGLLNAEPLEENIMFEYEKEVLGFYLSGHPLDSIKKDIVRYSDYALNNLPKIGEGQSFNNAPTIRVAGMLSSITIAMSKKKEEYAKFKIEDMDGSISAIMFSKTFIKYREILKPTLVAVVKGKLMGSQEKPELAVDEIVSLQEAKVLIKPKKTNLYIDISTTRYDDDLGAQLTDIFKRYEGSNAVFLDITDPLHGKFIIDTKYSVDCNDDFEKDIEDAVGGDGIVNFR